MNDLYPQWFSPCSKSYLTGEWDKASQGNRKSPRKPPILTAGLDFPSRECSNLRNIAAAIIQRRNFYCNDINISFTRHYKEKRGDEEVAGDTKGKDMMIVMGYSIV